MPLYMVAVEETAITSHQDTPANVAVESINYVVDCKWKTKN